MISYNVDSGRHFKVRELLDVPFDRSIDVMIFEGNGDGSNVYECFIDLSSLKEEKWSYLMNRDVVEISLSNLGYLRIMLG